MSILAIPRVKTDDSKQFYCLNIVLKNKNGPLVSEFSREKRDFTLPWYKNYWITTIGSLSNQEGDHVHPCHPTRKNRRQQTVLLPKYSLKEQKWTISVGIQ